MRTPSIVRAAGRVKWRGWLRVGPGSHEQKEAGSVWLDLLKALVWPVLVTVVIVLFFEPLKDISVLLPAKLKESTKFSVGSFSFEVAERVGRKGDLRGAAGVRSLSKDAVTLLLNTPGTHRWASTNDDVPTELGLAHFDTVKELVEAGLLRVYRSRRNGEYEMLSEATIQQVLAAGGSDAPEVAFEELTKRGHSGLVGELMRAKSQEILVWLMRFKWKQAPERDRPELLIDQGVSPDERSRILEVHYELSPSGRHVYDAMVAVVAEQMSAPVASANAPTTVPSAAPSHSGLQLSPTPPGSAD